MNGRTAAATLALLLALAAPRVAAATDADSLAAAERAFARMSVEQGVRAAFLAWLAPDGVIFRPRAENGRRAWEARGPVAATLAWEPAFAEVSAAGDLGWTTGPWELRPKDPQRPVGYGHFVSVWQRQPDGAWRVAVDIGVSHARLARGVGSGDFTPGPPHARAGAAAPDLVALDLAWSDDARAHGSDASFARRAAPDVRFYRDGEPPVQGVRAARERVRAVPGTTVWDPDAQRVARSGDLGCTYGVLERARTATAAGPSDSSVYLHVWRRDPDGRWRLALALENPIPRPGRK